MFSSEGGGLGELNHKAKIEPAEWVLFLFPYSNAMVLSSEGES